MNRKVAILVAVEKYVDSQIPTVKYARADAIELCAVLKDHGFEKIDQTIMIDNKATKTQLELRIKKITDGLTQEDILYFYYAGHGFARNAKNYITCHDTMLDDLENTSIPIEWLFKMFRESQSKNVVLFLDSCDSGMLATADVRGIYSDMTEEELKEFFISAEYYICFASCKPGQYSYPADKLRHGIWTYHLIEALKGEALTAIEKNGYLTSMSLQNYLAAVVPKTLRENKTGNLLQTPWSYGALNHEFLIADLSPILQKKQDTYYPHQTQIKHARLYHLDKGRISSLSGFKKKFHSEPDSANNTTNSFVGRIATIEIEDDLNETFTALKDVYAFKRNDLQTDGPNEGAGSIITPYFDYDVNISVNPEGPSDYILRREISNIRNPEKIFEEEFADVFPNVFDTIEYEFDTLISLENLIDQIESTDNDAIEVEYDPQVTECRINLKGMSLKIRVTKNAFIISHKNVQSPKVLLESFFNAQKALNEEKALKQLPFLKSPENE